jgi:hypothetical protein
MLVGQIVFERDSALWVFPARWFVRQSLLAGEFPTWNPYQGLGFPLLADPQYGVFYPPHWLLLLVPDRLVAHAVSWLSLLHLLWGGLGMMLLARRLGACQVGATVAGIVWTLSGHTISAWAIGPLLLGEAWIPWVALGFLRLARGEGRAPLASAVWPMALSLLVGEPFMSAMALVFAVAIVLAAGRGWLPTRAVLVSTSKTGLAWLVAVVIASVSWLPPLHMLESTERAQPFSRDIAESFSHHPLRMLEMALPGALSDPTGEYPAGHWVGEASVSRAPLFSSSYLGIVALGLALLGFRKRRLQLGLAGFALLALLVAFGKHTPAHEMWRQVLFPFAHMHSPEKYMVLVVAPFALLAGLGTSQLLQSNRASPRRLFYFAGVVLAFLLAAAWLLPSVLVHDARCAAIEGLGLLGVLSAATLLHRRLPRHAEMLVFLVTAFDLGLSAHHVTGFGPAWPLLTSPPAATAIRADNQSAPAPPRVYRETGMEQSADPLELNATWQDSQARAVRDLVPNTLNVFGLAVMPGYASAIPDVLTQLHPGTYQDLALMLRLFSMPYVLASDSFLGQLRTVTAADVIARPLPHGGLLHLANALPRVYLPSRIRSLPAEAVARALRSEAVVSGSEAIVRTTGPSRLTPAIAPEPGDACQLTTFRPSHIVASCKTSAPDLAVFVEQFDSGWSASVDGQSAPVLRTNLVMRAVPVPAGEHRVELRYRTPGLSLAIALSIVGLLALLTLALATAQRGAK